MLPAFRVATVTSFRPVAFVDFLGTYHFLVSYRHCSRYINGSIMHFQAQVCEIFNSLTTAHILLTHLNIPTAIPFINSPECVICNSLNHRHPLSITPQLHAVNTSTLYLCKLLHLSYLSIGDHFRSNERQKL